MTSPTNSLRGHLECFHVWLRDGDGAAIEEAPHLVESYIQAHQLFPQPVDKCSVPYMLALAKKLHDDKLIASCCTCENFDPKLEMCRLAGQRPPAQIIAYGCEQWVDVNLPF